MQWSVARARHERRRSSCAAPRVDGRRRSTLDQGRSERPASRRIVSRTPRKITKAMEVVAAAKLRRAQRRCSATRPYAREDAARSSDRAAARRREYTHPFLEQRERQARGVILVTTDKGLCGALNINIDPRAPRASCTSSQPKATATSTRRRRKGRDFLVRYRRDVDRRASAARTGPSSPTSLPGDRASASRSTTDGRGGRGAAASTSSGHRHAESASATVASSCCPIESAEREAEDARASIADYIYEPSAEEVLDALLPRYVEMQIYQAVLESQA